LERFPGRLFNYIMKSWSWLLLIFAALLVKFASTQPLWLEENYSTSIFPIISSIQRGILGWIPFSIGDIFYSFLVLVILVKTYQLIRIIFKRQLNRQFLLTGLKQFIFFFLFVYVFFYGFWGLNYGRKGINYQLSLDVRKYSLQDLDTVTNLLHERLNYYAKLVDLKQRDSLNKKRVLFEKTTEAYLYAVNEYPYLNYTPQSIKPSLFSYLGNYLGFQGYYNPFSGEGQVNTTIPRLMEPFVTAHEVAHQLGYARENEANFVAFLACRVYPNNTFRYSMYFDLFNYSVNELFAIDSLAAKKYIDSLHPQVKNDRKEVRSFFMKYKNPVEPMIMAMYGGFLKANNQPEGKRSYNQVLASLVAYYKKFGKEAL